MANNKKNPRWNGVNRRKGNDLLINVLNALTALAWLVFLAALFVADEGRPETGKFHIALFNLDLRDYWVPHLKKALFILLGVCTTISISSLLANQLRIKRKSDSFRLSLALLISLSAIITLNITL